ncbi:VOC family protein [Rhizobium sp. 32-5/1]|uniref:VOC family protein n=1 Tax=Rhizobium sp. 32-5/1 TaxID=3019602 RepID=UPI00240DC1F3|nr:VOC family protein [Rhizobium sp. 32-5/1]WEZ84877.1 VOC family protein [Rhizobium sp. 32-5/1]
MARLNLIILSVEDPLASVTFYRSILGQEPRFEVPTFSSFEISGGWTLGLLSTKSTSSLPPGEGNRMEIGFMVENEAAVQALYEDWQAKGVTIAEALAVKDFGPTFVGSDPDGHRLRVCLNDA